MAEQEEQEKIPTPRAWLWEELSYLLGETKVSELYNQYLERERQYQKEQRDKQNLEYHRNIPKSRRKDESS